MFTIENEIIRSSLCQMYSLQVSPTKVDVAMIIVSAWLKTKNLSQNSESVKFIEKTQT